MKIPCALARTSRSTQSLPSRLLALALRTNLSLLSFLISASFEIFYVFFGLSYSHLLDALWDMGKLRNGYTGGQAGCLWLWEYVAVILHSAFWCDS